MSTGVERMREQEQSIKKGIGAATRNIPKRRRRILRYVDRIMDTGIIIADRLLMGGYTLPSKSGQVLSGATGRLIGDVSWLARDVAGLPVSEIVGEEGRIIYVGRDQGRRFLTNKLFSSGSEMGSVGHVSLGALGRKTTTWLKDGADLVISEVSCLYPDTSQTQIAFSVPTWINQEIAVPEYVDEVIAGNRARGVRGAINKSVKNGLTYRFTRELRDFEYFYHRMYVPTALGRHEELALVASQRMQQWWFGKSGLLLIEKEGEPVAGGLTMVHGRTCIGIEGGVLDGRPDLFQSGLNAFLMWCNLIWARQQGATRFNMGGSRPLTTNGSFGFKCKWGAQVVRRRRPYARWSFHGNRLNDRLCQRIEALGLISELKGRFYALHLGDDIVRSSDAQWESALQRAADNGLGGVMMMDRERGIRLVRQSVSVVPREHAGPPGRNEMAKKTP